jgi:hypothetical protein
LLVGNGTAASGNTITATGSATGIKAAYSSAKITNNTINIGSGTGIYILQHILVDAATVTSNTLSGTGHFGIYAQAPARAGGGDIYNNTITGFATPLYAPGAGPSRGR